MCLKPELALPDWVTFTIITPFEQLDEMVSMAVRRFFSLKGATKAHQTIAYVLEVVSLKAKALIRVECGPCRLVGRMVGW